MEVGDSWDVGKIAPSTADWLNPRSQSAFYSGIPTEKSLNYIRMAASDPIQPKVSMFHKNIGQAKHKSAMR